MIYELTQAAPKTSNVMHPGGALQVQVSGEFGGATVNLNISQDALPEQALSDFLLTEPNALLVDMLANCSYNFELTGATVATEIKVSVLD